MLRFALNFYALAVFAAFGAAASFCTALSTPSHAQGYEGAGSAESRQPLVIIRFNQRITYFEKPLATAVSRAVAVKPDVVFDVLQLIPQSARRAHQKGLEKAAAMNLARVVTVLHDAGIPENRIRVKREIDINIKADEVRIFVQ